VEYFFKSISQESGPIEAVYMFPIEEEAAVVDFKAEIENRVIKTEVKKKEEARAAYDKAMQVKFAA
jgi:Ca-activated chloride channel family protein